MWQCTVWWIGFAVMFSCQVCWLLCRIQNTLHHCIACICVHNIMHQSLFFEYAQKPPVDMSSQWCHFAQLLWQKASPISFHPHFIWWENWAKWKYIGSHWVECQEWQMWFKISSPAFITANAFPRECHFIPRVCLFAQCDLTKAIHSALLLLPSLRVLAQTVYVMSVQLPWDLSHSIRQYIPPWAGESVQSASSVTADNCIGATRTA